MAARSSNEIVQRPFNPVLPPVIDLKSQEKLVFKDNETVAGPDSFEFITEKFVDFESLKVNGIDIQSLFYDQQWKNYFEMLNGFVYYDIVKYFWQKATIFDKFNSDEEVKKMVEKDGSLKGKTRTQLGLRPFRGKEIRSNIMGINVLITQEHIAKILGLDNEGENVDEYGEKSKHIESIKKDLFLPGCANNDFGKAKFMKQIFSFAFKVFLASIITREGGYDTISLPHRHFIWFLYKKVKINLAKLLFDHLCFTISKSRSKSPSMIHHPRLISEIIRQTKLTQIISTKEKLRVFNTAKYDASVLVNMHLKTKEELKSAKSPLEQVYEKYFWCNGFPTISEFDNDEVIKNFLELVRLDSGVSVPRSMVVGVPNWDIFKGPKQITRSKRKPQPIEQDIVEEEQSEERVDGAERITTEETEEVSKEQATKIAQRKAAQKERRTKKRQDRPADAEEEQPVRATKRKKSVVSKQKAADSGKHSMPNIDSTASAHPSTQSPPIDYTQPIRMIQPSPKSSSSEETLSDSSIDSTELIVELDKLEKEKPVHKPTKRITKKPIYGSVYKPLTIEELCLPIDFALPILEDLVKAEINVDDDIITIDPFDKIKRIKIIPLKRKRPEPTIPFNRNQPFFNYNSEPNLELLESAINISLRNFKSMEEEVLIFPSDIDAKIRELEEKFSQSLRLLGGYVKRRIEGRGMEALSQIMNAAERSHALRLTFFNHEEECQRLAFLAAVDESMRRSLDEEQARIAAEMERQRLAEQEALKLLVDRAVHIAVIETNKIFENQGAAEDTVMNDQNLSKPDSDKGKAPIVASSPPRSPPVLVQGFSSSAIPSVMQEALDVIKHDLREELRNEMDEFRADIREDMNRSGEATNKKIDAMMELLLKLTQQQPKP
ncbi:hypothetical protein QL285_082147 [Trifolium repens]|nr:hypothetical protein QL285_082147 [Trifolium repens]